MGGEDAAMVPRRRIFCDFYVDSEPARIFSGPAMQFLSQLHFNKKLHDPWRHFWYVLWSAKLFSGMESIEKMTLLAVDDGIYSFNVITIIAFFSNWNRMHFQSNFCRKQNCYYQLQHPGKYEFELMWVPMDDVCGGTIRFFAIKTSFWCTAIKKKWCPDEPVHNAWVLRAKFNYMIFMNDERKAEGETGVSCKLRKAKLGFDGKESVTIRFVYLRYSIVAVWEISI